jgi:hypothetical protein
LPWISFHVVVWLAKDGKCRNLPWHEMPLWLGLVPEEAERFKIEL